MERTLKTTGTSIVQVTAGNFIRGGESVNIASGLGAATSLTREDAAAIAAIADVQHVAAELRSRAFVEASPQARVFAPILGTEPAVAEIHGWTFLSGEPFTADDVAGAKQQGRPRPRAEREDLRRRCRSGGPAGHDPRPAVHRRRLDARRRSRSGRSRVRAGHDAGCAHRTRLPAADHDRRHRSRRRDQGRGRGDGAAAAASREGDRDDRGARVWRAWRPAGARRPADVSATPTTSSCGRWPRSRSQRACTRKSRRSRSPTCPSSTRRRWKRWPAR